MTICKNSEQLQEAEEKQEGTGHMEAWERNQTCSGVQVPQNELIRGSDVASVTLSHKTPWDRALLMFTAVINHIN